MKSRKARRRTPAPAGAAANQSQLAAAQATVHSSQPGLPLGENLFTVLIVLITFLVFLPVLNNGFVDSDNRPLVENLNYRGLGWPQLYWMFTAFHFGQYQPLAWMTLGMDHVLWWADPFGHHLTALLLHVVNAALLYRVSLEFLSHWRSGNDSREAPFLKVAAGFAALGFVLHPLRVESVAWASVRGEMVAAGFFLLSLLGYLKANAPVHIRHDEVRWMTISASAFLLSLLASPSGLVLPMILLVMDGYPLRRLEAMRDRFGAEAKRHLREKAPYLALSIACIAMTLASRKFDPIAQSIYRDDMITWILHQLAAPAFYLWKAIVPVALSPAYELDGWSIAIYIAMSGILCAAVVAVRVRWPALLPIWICYLMLLLPILRSEFPAEQILADRYTYLAGLPWALLIGVVADQYLRSGGVGKRQPAVWGMALTVVALALLGGLSWNQIRVWRDSETLWRHAIEVNPTGRAHFNFATLSEMRGNYHDAIASNKHVVELNPQRWDAHERAARLLQQQGRIAEAVEHYRVVVRLNPSATDARENFAAGLVNRGDIAEAIQQFRKVLELAPERNGARVKLGTILAVENRLAEAEELLMAAARADPNDGRIQLHLGRVLAAQGKLNEAVNYFREAARLRSEDAEAHENLGRALAELGRKDEAAKHLQQALRILRSSPAAR